MAEKYPDKLCANATSGPFHRWSVQVHVLRQVDGGYASLPQILCVYCILDVRVYLHETTPDISVLSDQDLWIPSHGDEDGVDATCDWRHEDLAHLQPDKERVGHDYGGEGAPPVVLGFRKFEVEVRE